MISFISSSKENIHLFDTDSYLSYLPLPHAAERSLAYSLVSEGCSIGYYGGDVLKLKDDLAELQPTIFLSVKKNIFN